MEALFPFIIFGAIFIFFATVFENNKKTKKQKNKERLVQKTAAKKLRIKNDKIFVGSSLQNRLPHRPPSFSRCSIRLPSSSGCESLYG